MSVEATHPEWPSILPELKEREAQLCREISTMERSGIYGIQPTLDKTIEALTTLREFIKEYES